MTHFKWATAAIASLLFVVAIPYEDGSSPISAAQAQTSKSILDSQGCSGCHAANERVVGPSFAEIRKRYAGKPGSEEQLATAMRMGSRGRWGIGIDMPPNPSITNAEASRLAAIIMKGR